MTPNVTDPLPGYKFVVVFQGAPAGWFTECSGLTLERGVITQAEGGVNDYEHQLPGPISYSRLTLKRGLADNILWDWFQQGLYDGKVERRHITVTLLNPDGSEARHWDLTNAYPLRWVGLDFQSDSDQIGVETLELAAGGGSEQTLAQRALGETTPSTASAVAAPPVDVPLLAQKVYALLKRDLEIERQRLGRA
jgi:phage tail-like protein